MRRVFVFFGLCTAWLTLLAAPLASAQEMPQYKMPNEEGLKPEAPKGEGALPDGELSKQETATEDSKSAPKGGRDLTVRSKEGRAEMLLELFENLKAAPDAKGGELVAEEIWAVFLQSGSASIDYALLRGIAAQTNGDLTLARRMFDHVTRLEPDFAEGWSRSGRLAIKEKNLSRAAADTTQSLILEPRHFYALWTLGNILEKMGKPNAAYEAYLEANKLHPEHEKIKERVEFLKEDAKGTAL